MRALPAESLEYLELTALGNTALPTETGAGAGVAAGAEAVEDAGAAAGAAPASEPHCALRKSFHFMPLSEPSVLAALYLALHSVIVSACADVPCKAMAATTAPAQRVRYLMVIVELLRCFLTLKTIETSGNRLDPDPIRLNRIRSRFSFKHDPFRNRLPLSRSYSKASATIPVPSASVRPASV